MQPINPIVLPWLARPGLAGGIDKDGSRALELLGLGFGLSLIHI